MVFQVASLQSHNCKIVDFHSIESTLNRTCFINYKKGRKKLSNSASWSATSPSQRYLDILLLGTTHTNMSQKREEKKDKYTINVFLCLCYWVFKFKKKFHVYGNVIKKIKRWQCVFCYVCFFKLCCNYICRMPNKHCNMYHPCRRVFIFSVLIVIIFTLSSPLNLHSRHIYTKTDIR